MSSNWGGYTSNFGNDGIYNDSNNYAHCNNDISPFDWMQYNLPVSTLISSVFIFIAEWGCYDRNNFLLNVGNSSPPYLNPICHNFGPTSPTGVTSGWYKCTTPLTGTKIGLSRQDQNYLHFSELWIYSEIYIQEASTATLSSIYTGSAALNCIFAAPRIVQFATQSSACSTNTGQITNSLTIQFGSLVPLSRIVIIPTIGFETDITILINSGGTNLKSQILSNAFATGEIHFPSKIDQIIISRSSQLSIVSVGVLSHPYCPTTTWDNGSGLVPVVTLTYILGQILPVIHQMSKDTASETYGNLDGYSLCGGRSVNLIDTSSGIDQIGLSGITLSTLGDSLQFTYLSTGTFQYTLLYSLTEYPWIASQSQIINVNVVLPTCAQSLDFPTITPPILSNQVYIWTQNTGSYTIPAFTVASTLSICNLSDIVYTILLTGSLSGSTTFITFSSVSMLFNWFDSIVRLAETFTVVLNATITNSNTGSPFVNTTTFQLVVTPPTCAQSLDFPTITPPILSNQVYIWTQNTGSYTIPAFTVVSTLSICSASDIVYTTLITGSLSGSTTFITFNSVSMLFNWFDSTIRLDETFTVILTASITDQNSGPFISTSTFQLIVTKPNCIQSLDLPTITPSILSNQVYIWTQTTGSYTIPAFTVASTLSICSASDIVYTILITGSLSGSTTFITFNSVSMLVNWFESTIRLDETFTIFLTATITDMNSSPYIANSTFQLVVTSPTCEQSLDFPTITPSTLSNQVYTWTQPTASYTIPAFIVASTLSICTTTDIVYTMSIFASAGGSTNFITFNSITMLMNWFDSINRIAETFTIILTAKISNLNGETPFISTSKFQLVVSQQEYVMIQNTPILQNGKKYNDTIINFCDLTSDILEFGPVQLFDKNQEVILKQEVVPNSKYFLFDDQSAKLQIDRTSLNQISDKEGTLIFQVIIVLDSILQKNISQKYKFTLVVTNCTVEVKKSDQQDQSKTLLKLPQKQRPFFDSIDIDNEGLVKVFFSEPMTIPSSINVFNDQVLDVQLIQPFSGDKKYFNYTWNTTDFQTNYIQLQLNFDRPLYISAQGISLSDKLKVQVIQTQLFLSKANIQPIIEDSFVIQNIPVQLSNNKKANIVFKEAIQVAGKVTDTIISTSLVSNLLLGASMSMLWGSINALQIITYLVFFNLQFPANVQVFFQSILKISNLNFISSTDLYDNLFPFLKQNDKDKKNKRITSILQQIGSLLLYLVIMIALLPFYLILKFFANHYTFVEGVYIKIRDTLFWNYPLRYVMETYLALTLFAFTQIFTEGLVWDSGLLIVSSIFALLCLIIFVVIPIPMTWFFRKNVKKYPRKLFQNKFGDITRDFYWRSSNASNFIAIFCYRRLIQILLIIFAAQYPFSQIITITITCQIAIVVFGYSDVMLLPISRRLEYFNESMILVAVYHMYLFTDFVADPELRYQIGFSFIIFAAFACLVNFSFTIFHTINAVCLFYKKVRQWYREKKNFQAIKKNNEKRQQQLEELNKKRIKKWRETGVMDDNEDPQANNLRKQKHTKQAKTKPLEQINEESGESSNSIRANQKQSSQSKIQHINQNLINDKHLVSQPNKLFIQATHKEKSKNDINSTQIRQLESNLIRHKETRQKVTMQDIKRSNVASERASTSMSLVSNDMFQLTFEEKFQIRETVIKMIEVPNKRWSTIQIEEWQERLREKYPIQTYKQ